MINKEKIEKTLDILPSKILGVMPIILIVSCLIAVGARKYILQGYPNNGFRMVYNSQPVPEEFVTEFASNRNKSHINIDDKTLDFMDKNILVIKGVAEKAREEGYEFLYNGQQIDPSNYILSSDNDYAVISFTDQKVLITEQTKWTRRKK